VRNETLQTLIFGLEIKHYKLWFLGEKWNTTNIDFWV